MGKYFSSGDGSGVWATGGGRCATAAALSAWGAVAFDGPTTTGPVLWWSGDREYKDLVDLGLAYCWLVSGRAVVIGGKIGSWQAGMERVNWNFHVDGTLPPVPTLIEGMGMVV